MEDLTPHITATDALELEKRSSLYPDAKDGDIYYNPLFRDMRIVAAGHFVKINEGYAIDLDELCEFVKVGEVSGIETTKNVDIPDDILNAAMTYRDAAKRIQEHMVHHFKAEYPHAVQITTALNLAVKLLEQAAETEIHKVGPKCGDDVWYVDAEMQTIEHGTVLAVAQDEGKITGILVDFDGEDVDEFYDSAWYTCLFPQKELAEKALRDYKS